MATSKKPTGGTISRNGLKFTFSWKRGENYDKMQELQYKVADKWVTVSGVTKSTTSKTVEFAAGDFYPTKKACNRIYFRVRGRRSNRTVSGWHEKDLEIKAPKAPGAVTYSATADNAGTFSFSVDGNNEPFVNLEYQHVLIKNYTGGSYSNANFSGATVGTVNNTSGAVTVTESSATLAGASYTRIFRVRSRGMGGFSGWVYGAHVYATPNKPTITKATYSGGTVKAEWKLTAPQDKPADIITSEYKIAVPNAGMVCPDGAWTSCASLKRTGETMAAQYQIDDSIGLDECLWVRAVAEHDNNKSYSAPYLASVGKLSAPGLNSGSINGTTLNVSIDARSGAPDSFTIIYLKLKSTPTKPQAIGYINHAGTGGAFTVPPISEDYQVGARAFIGSVSSVTTDGVTTYSVIAKASSDEVWLPSTTVAIAPKTVNVEAVNNSTARISWSWDWKAATGVKITWADHADAWESTDEPEEFTINKKVTAWNVGGLKEGSTYYFRVSLIDDDGLESPASNAVTISLATIPTSPVLAISESITNIDGVVSFTIGASAVGFAEVVEIVDGVIVEANGGPVVLANGNTSEAISFTIEGVNALYSSLGLEPWAEGDVKYLTTRVFSAGGDVSAWSDTASITIVKKPAITNITTSLINKTIADDDGITRTVNALTAMPLTVRATGAGVGGTTSIYIARAQSYEIERPDGRNAKYFDGEIVAAQIVEGENMATFELSDIIGSLDDGAMYKIIVTISDSYGQSATQEVPFEVAWSHQPQTPDAVASASGMIAVFSVDSPEGYADGDTFDAYRLSADNAELIIEGGSYGVTYVDPFPAFNYGGVRIVNKTPNGDYITETNELAWLDLPVEIPVKSIVIEFDGNALELPYNINLSSTWNKDFKRTEYLGGSVAGDWNAATTRDISASVSVVPAVEGDKVRILRDLATYADVCHVRTPEGSSYNADIQISEDQSNDKIINFRLTIKKIDTVEPEGMTLAKWHDLND